MGEFSLTHLLVLAIILLVFFGPSRLPQLGKSIGKAFRGFKSGLSEIDAEAKDVVTPAPEQLKKPDETKTFHQAEKDSKKTE